MLDLKKNFSQSLRAVREKSGLNGAQVAKAIGVTRGTYSKYEGFDSGVLPSLEHYIKMAEVFNVSLDALIGLKTAPGVLSPWLADLLSDLEALDKPGRDAVKALIKGLSRG